VKREGGSKFQDSGSRLWVEERRESEGGAWKMESRKWLRKEEGSVKEVPSFRFQVPGEGKEAGSVKSET
jgi:hypothetical protein